MIISKPNVGREPVPDLSKLMALSFLAGISGALRAEEAVAVRLTLHRVMTRGPSAYLQQICPYLPTSRFKESDAGRIFSVDEGIMGEAYSTCSIWRTKYYSSPDVFEGDLISARMAVGESADLPKARSWLAIPFIGQDGEPVMILFAESERFNFFSSDDIVHGIIDACNGFSEFLNLMNHDGPDIAKNYPLDKGIPAKGKKTVYRGIHEKIANHQVKTRLAFRSYNFGG